MKPYESKPEIKFNGGNTCLNVEGVGIVAFAPFKWAEFFAAAPAVTRALKGMFGDARHLTMCRQLRDPKRPCHPDCKAAREALIAAGAMERGQHD